MQDRLFVPIRINHLEIKNRIYMPAMHMAMCEDYNVTDQLIDFYVERAKGGAGLIGVGYATVDERSGGSQNIGAHDDRFLPGLKRLSAAISDNGARCAIQLNHAGRYSHSILLGGKQPVAPSAIESRLTKETPHELSHREIDSIVAAFAQAALRSKNAGFDAIEILSGTGYLISEFLSPVTNHRKDAYGGSLENRMRFGIEVVTAVRDILGSDYPLLVRMNGNDLMPGGQGRKELQEYAKVLVACGVDALNINVGWHEARVPQITASVPKGIYAYLARGIKERTDIPVIASHRISEPEVARNLILNGMCDMVAMGRSLIADPFLPEKARSGREHDIIHCIACAQGCFDNLFKLKSVECLCNPRAGRESKKRPPRVSAPKKIMVIGGGPAGMSAALSASANGHHVMLCEQSDHLGGQLHLAGAPPGREEFIHLAQDLEKQLRLKEIDITLNMRVDQKQIQTWKPDAVVLASGALPVSPSIPGVDAPHVVQAWDALRDNVVIGPTVAIIGAGAVGVETALFLADKGTLSGEAIKFLLINQAETPETLYELATSGTKKITIIDMINRVGSDIGKSTRWSLLQDLERCGVTIQMETRVLEIIDQGVRIKQGENESELMADTVITAMGAVSCNELIKDLEILNIPFKVVGDANHVGKAFDAVHQGYAAGLEI